ncbi:porin family protein [Photobacterium sp. DA100]|uniref:porin family protein n=1 Tax=Photobacterium sp. DA100 TaxID=3027472 RepID=UPI00247ACE22|nr:porin family protein [Photobacterium sp. DA100]WEM41785.1 porin family protein [Photobacterium sp. DA100]
MKKTIFALTIASLLSTPALASKEGFYIGADIGSNSIEGDSVDAGLGLVAGYDFQVTPQVVIGVEGEYRNMGEDKYSEGGQSIKYEARSFGVNVKPKYYFNENFFAGVQLGVHSVKEELSSTIDWLNGDDTNTGISYGLEAGYEFNKNIAVKGGYRGTSTSHTDFDTFYIGANYKF